MGIKVTRFPYVNSVPHWEMDNSPVEVIDENGFRATRFLKCAWSDRLTLVLQMLGYTVGSNSVNVHMPAPYPDHFAAVAVSAEPTPFGRLTDNSNQKLAVYNHAIVKVNYKVPNYELGYDNPNATLTSETFEPSTEFITLPNRKLYWDNAQVEGLDIDEAPGALVHMMDWVYTIHSIPYIPAAILDYVGMVNTFACYSSTLEFTFAPYTLLYNPPVMSTSVTTQGYQAWELTLRFTYRPQGWDKFARAGQGITFSNIYDENGDIVDIYQTADLNDILLSI